MTLFEWLLVGHLIGALSGGALYRKASFLLDSLGPQVWPRGYSLIERPHVRGALGSAAFDAEGVATYEKAFVDDGVVASYVLGSYSARRLGLTSTATAGGIHNLFVEGPRQDPVALYRRMRRGLLVRDTMGQGVNLVTGDYAGRSAKMP